VIVPGADLRWKLRKRRLHHLWKRGMDEDRATHDVHREARADEVRDPWIRVDASAPRMWQPRISPVSGSARTLTKPSWSSIEEPKTVRASTPKSLARRTVRATSATGTSIFDGMQPRFRQVPPNGPLSTTAVRHPREAPADDTSAPEPIPMTMRSNLSEAKPRPTGIE
jgi:hypothetical protein